MKIVSIVIWELAFAFTGFLWMGATAHTLESDIKGLIVGALWFITLTGALMYMAYRNHIESKQNKQGANDE